MTNEPNGDPKTIADLSSFTLQIRIAELINKSAHWKVYLEEHPWKSPYNESKGFIDIVAKHDVHKASHMVIECKRAKQSQWIFLIPETELQEEAGVRVWMTRYQESHIIFGFQEYDLRPSTLVARYWSIQGEEQGRRNSLEKTSAALIHSMEALAYQEKKLKEGKGSVFDLDYFSLFVPVIVTTAALKVACFDPGRISLEDGSLPDNAVFKDVPYIRFRKSLSNRGEPTGRGNSLQDALKDMERTVFIVNAQNFDDFMLKWDIQ